MTEVDPSWVLALMLRLEPQSPHRATFERTASAIAHHATVDPLPLGEDREAKTATVDVAIAWFESRFQPDAQGDCDKTTDKGICAPGSRPHSFCLVQVSETNFRGLRTSRDEVQADVDKCLAAGHRLMHQSFRVCANKPLEDRLNWYAAGGPTCTEPRRQEGRHRMRKAIALFKELPPPKPEE